MCILKHDKNKIKNTLLYLAWHVLLDYT